MSEIYDEGLLPPNVHHARPEKPERSDEEADRERVEEDTGPREDPRQEDATTQPPADARRESRGGTDDPYATEGDDPYAEPAEPATTAPKPERSGADSEAGEGGADATGAVGTGASGTGTAGTAEPPD